MQITTIDSDLAFFARLAANGANPVQRRETNRGVTAPSASRTAPPSGSVPEAIETINNHLRLAQRAVRLVPRPDAHSTVIEVVDRETDQVIRQIPADNALKLAAWFEENGMLSDRVQAGFALDKKV